MKPVATSSPQAKTPVVACCEVTPRCYYHLILIYLREEVCMKTYHVTQVFEEYEYYRVEAESEEEAREKVDNGEVESHNWDRSYQYTEVEVGVG